MTAETPPANRLLIEFTYTSQNNGEGVHTKILDKEDTDSIFDERVGYADNQSKQILFIWHNEILEQKYKKMGRKYIKDKKKKSSSDAAKSSNLFD